MSAHTPGPWTAEKDLRAWPDGENLVLYYGIYAKQRIACMEEPSCGIDTPPDEQEANARLMAAAPDLLRALEELLIWTVLKEKGSPYLTNMRKPIVINQVKEAILKATGEAPSCKR